MVCESLEALPKESPVARAINMATKRVRLARLVFITLRYSYVLPVHAYASPMILYVQCFYVRITDLAAFAQ
jgi:hypothetical protein